MLNMRLIKALCVAFLCREVHGQLGYAFKPGQRGFGKMDKLISLAGQGGKAIWDFGWDTFERGPIQSGKEIKGSHWGPCGELPLLDTENYQLIRPLAKALDNMTLANVPFFKSGILFQSGLAGMIGYCGATSSDTFAFQLNPSFPYFRRSVYPQKWPIKPYFTGLGFSSKSGGFLYDHPALNVYDGFQASPVKAKGDIWVKGGFDVVSGYGWAPQDWFQAQTDLTFFGDKKSASNMYLVVETMKVSWAFFTLMTFGEGYGGYRHTDSASEQICHPNGFFVSFTQNRKIPSLSEKASEFFQVEAATLEKRQDVGILWNDGDSKQLVGAFVRDHLRLAILGYSLGDVDIEVQYITSPEAKRRKTFREKASGCQCITGYDSSNLCKDALSPADKWLESNAHAVDNVFLLSARFTSELAFSLSPIALRDAVVVVAVDTGGKYHITIGGEVTMLFVSGVQTYLTVSDGKLTLSLSVYVANVKCTISGSGSAKGYGVKSLTRRQLGAKSFLDTAVDLSVDWDFGQVGKEISQGVSAALTETRDVLKTSWSKVEDNIKGAISRVHSMFSRGGELAAFAGDVEKYLRKDVIPMVKALVKVPVINEIMQIGEKIATGAMKSFVNSAKDQMEDFLSGLKDLVCSTSHGGTRRKKGKGAHHCQLMEYRWRECCGVGPFKHCSWKHRGEFEEPKCMDRVASAGHKLSKYLNVAAKTKAFLDDSRNKSTGFLGNSALDIKAVVSSIPRTSKVSTSQQQEIKLSFQVQRLASPGSTYGGLESKTSTFKTDLSVDVSSSAATERSLRNAIAQVKSEMFNFVRNGNQVKSVSLVEESKVLNPPILDTSLAKVSLSCSDLSNLKPTDLAPQVIQTEDAACGDATLHYKTNRVTQRACGIQEIHRTWWAVDGCNVQSPKLTQTITVQPQAPSFVDFPQDKTVDMAAWARYVVDTGHPKVKQPCQGTATPVIKFVDKVIMSSCERRVVEREWTAFNPKCPSLRVSRVQRITSLDKDAPHFTKLPKANISLPYGASLSPDMLGYAKASDKGQHALIKVTFEDTTKYDCSTFTQVVVRTWKATDPCTRLVSKFVQTINIEKPLSVWQEFPPTTYRHSRTVTALDPKRTGTPQVTQGFSIRYTDKETPRAGNCAARGWTIVRTWEARFHSCTQNIVRRDQLLREAINHPGPTFSRIPDREVEFLAPYGTDTTGYPSISHAYAYPVDITFIDNIMTKNSAFGYSATVHRVWTATDACGDTSRYTQTIRVRSAMKYFGGYSGASKFQIYAGSSLKMDTVTVEGAVASAGAPAIVQANIGQGTCSKTSIYALATELCPLSLTGLRLASSKYISYGTNRENSNVNPQRRLASCKSIPRRYRGVTIRTAAMNFQKVNELLQSFSQELHNKFGKLSSGPSHLRVVLDASGSKRVDVLATSAAIQTNLNGTTFISSNSLYNVLDADVATIIEDDTMREISIKSDGFVFVNIIGTYQRTIVNLKPFKGVNPENLLVNAPAFTGNMHMQGATGGTWLLSNEKSNTHLSKFQLTGGQLLSLGALELTTSHLRCGIYSPNA
mmetsp:Transcript_904/g.1761  ORF Transcript_904/g.1761 Transcript_904/m.1761 type:complete len:1548 (-) Transcript_904:129-4772(-)